MTELEHEQDRLLHLAVLKQGYEKLMLENPTMARYLGNELIDICVMTNFHVDECRRLRGWKVE